MGNKLCKLGRAMVPELSPGTQIVAVSQLEE